MKGFKKDGKFIPIGNRKNGLSSNQINPDKLIKKPNTDTNNWESMREKKSLDIDLKLPDAFEKKDIVEGARQTNYGTYGEDIDKYYNKSFAVGMKELDYAISILPKIKEGMNIDDLVDAGIFKDDDAEYNATHDLANIVIRNKSDIAWVFLYSSHFPNSPDKEREQLAKTNTLDWSSDDLDNFWADTISRPRHAYHDKIIESNKIPNGNYSTQ